MGPYPNAREASDSLDRYVASCRRQSDMAPSWPRWLHLKYWFRRLSGAPDGEPSPNEV